MQVQMFPFVCDNGDTRYFPGKTREEALRMLLDNGYRLMSEMSPYAALARGAWLNTLRCKSRSDDAGRIHYAAIFRYYRKMASK